MVDYILVLILSFLDTFPIQSVQSLSRVRLTLCDPMDCSMPGFPGTSSQNLLKLMSMESVMSSNQLILCHPLLLLPSIGRQSKMK